MSIVFQAREKSLKPRGLRRMLISCPRTHQELSPSLQIGVTCWRPGNSFLNSLSHPGLLRS